MGPQSPSARYKEVNIIDLTGTRTPIPWKSSPQAVAIPTELPRLVIRKMFSYSRDGGHHETVKCKFLRGYKPV
jgi:hypothetical protein